MYINMLDLPAPTEEEIKRMNEIDDAIDNIKLGNPKKEYCYSPHERVRIAAAKHRFRLDILIDDPSAEVRYEVAIRCYDMNKLVYDPEIKVRKAMTNKSCCLDILVNDEAWEVREAVAESKHGLDKLVNDEDYRVRKAVAKQGYGLEKLVKDENWEVRCAVARQLKDLKYLNSLKNDPDKFVRWAVESRLKELTSRKTNYRRVKKMDGYKSYLNRSHRRKQYTE